MSSVQIIDHSAAWLAKEKVINSKALRKMGMAVVALANAKGVPATPKKTGALRQSGHIEGMGDEISVVFGNSSVTYAAAQEAGQRDGVPFKHYTTPGTGPHFLKNAGNMITKKGIVTYR